MSDDQGILQELAAVKAERDRYGSLVGSCMNANGSVVPALENAANQSDLEQMRTEIRAVLNFLRDNNPFGPAATPF